MTNKTVSSFSLAGMRRNPLPVVGCIVLGAAMGTAATIKLDLIDPDGVWIARKKRQLNEEDNANANLMQTQMQVFQQLAKSISSLSERIEKAQNIEKAMRLKETAPPPAPPTQVPTYAAGDVFELSQIIEANNIANSTSHQRELRALRESLIREHLLKVDGEITKVENRYRPIVNKIRELELHLETQNQIQQKEAPARLLWISCQALLDRMRFEPQSPLEKDPAYDVLKGFAANNNPLAISVLDSLPAKALKEGIQSEETLIDRFSKVERVCKRVAMVDGNGGGIAKYLVSYLQSLFIIDNVTVLEDEVAGRQLVDPTKWNTFEIVARVRYCLAKHNLDQALRYANQLRGQARVVARDWIRDARLHLETKQALNILSTHAEAIAVDAIRQTFVK